MNREAIQDSDTISIHLTGHFTISRQEFKCLLAEVLSVNLPPMPPTPAVTPPSPLPSEPERLAYTMKETAALLGVSYITVHRLIQRGHLKSSLAVRHKIIPRTEIEKFLKNSVQAL